MKAYKKWENTPCCPLTCHSFLLCCWKSDYDNLVKRFELCDSYKIFVDPHCQDFVLLQNVHDLVYSQLNVM